MDDESASERWSVRVLHSYSKHVAVGVDPWKLLIRAQKDDRPVEPLPITKRALSPTEAQVDALVARYAELQSLRLLASETGLERATVRAHLKRRGVKLNERRSMESAEIARAVELYQAGKSSAAVGKVLGFDNHTVLKELRAAGVSIRPRSGR